MSARSYLAVGAITLVWLAAGCDDSPDNPGEQPPPVDAAITLDAMSDLPDEGVGVDMAAPDPDVGDAPEPDAALEPDAMVEPWTSAACDEAEFVGAFEIILAAAYTAVQGQVFDSVAPLNVSVVDRAEGECALLRPPSLFCQPSCEVGQTCGPDEECVPQPEPIDLGPVTVSGLTAAVEMEARAPVYFYTFRGDLPHPGFAEGDPIRLDGAGLDAIAPFSLRGAGVAPIVTAQDTVALDPGQPAEVSWDPPGVDGPAQMHVELNIANHGGTPARVVCTTADDGAFAVPATLVDRLLELGFSGFPSLTLTRRTVDRVDLAPGCVELRVTAATTLDVAIDGLVSCSTDDDCPPDQMCRLDLTCGPAAEENP